MLLQEVHLVSQDLSVAGKRAGLDGERSGLFMEQIRIVKEMREHDSLSGRPIQLIRPRYCVWENVPGAFSSNGGKDFQAVLTEFIKVSVPNAPDVPMPERGDGASQDSSTMQWEDGAWPGGLTMRSTTVYRNGEKESVYWLTSTGFQQARFCLTLNMSERPRTANPSRLSDILETSPNEKYKLSAKACQGILNRAERRGKELPAELKAALIAQSVSKNELENLGVAREYSCRMNEQGPCQPSTINQSAYPINTMVATRDNDESRTTFGIGAADDPQFTLSAAHEHAVFTDLYNGNITGETAATLNANSGASNHAGPTVMQDSTSLNPWEIQQQRVQPRDGIAPTISAADKRYGAIQSLVLDNEVKSAGFSFGQSDKARSIGYQEEMSPTLRGGDGGNQKPVVMCENPQDPQSKRVFDPSGVGPTLNSGTTEGMNIVPSIMCGNPWDSQSERVFHGDGSWHSLNANESGGHSRDAVLAFSQNQREEVRELGDCAGSVSAEMGTHQQTFVKAYSFDSMASNSMKSANPHSGCREVETAKTLDCFDPNPSKNQGGIAVLAVDCRNGVKSDINGTLQSSCGKNVNSCSIIRTQDDSP